MPASTSSLRSNLAGETKRQARVLLVPCTSLRHSFLWNGFQRSLLLSKITSRAARRLNRPKASAKLHNPLHITKLFDEKIWHKKRENHRNHTQIPYNQQIIKNNFFSHPAARLCGMNLLFIRNEARGNDKTATGGRRFLQKENNALPPATKVDEQKSGKTLL